MQKILCLLRRCVEDYDMIAPGERVAVGVSGGKDSLVLLAALALCVVIAVRYRRSINWRQLIAPCAASFFTNWLGLQIMSGSPDTVLRRLLGAALMALAQFRGIDVFEFFYAGDNLDREQWDPRSLSTHAKLDEKDRAAYLALELARKITL